MNNKCTIYFVRHGENPANLRRELSCNLIDYPLTSKGRWQALRTAEFFLEKDIHAIFTSPLKRAFETASIIADVLKLKPVARDEFRELNVGVLENDPASDSNWRIHDQILEDWKGRDPSRSFPGGERYIDVIARMKSGIRNVLCGTGFKNTIVVTHGGIVNTTIGLFCHMPSGQMLHDYTNCAVTSVDFDMQASDGQGYLKEWAFTGHLSHPEGNGHFCRSGQ